MRGQCKSAEGQTRFIRLGIVVVAAAGLLYINGCSVPNEGSDGLTDPNSTWGSGINSQANDGGETAGEGVGGRSSAGADERNIEQWAMPLDEFQVGVGELDNYAEQLLVQPCLEAAGYSWPVPWQDVDELVSETSNEAGRRLFNIDIAQKWGYRIASVETESSRLWAEFIEKTAALNADDNFNSVFGSCIDEVRVEYPLIDMDDRMFVRSLALQSERDADLAPEVVESEVRWRECMESLGLGELPNSPVEMPTAEIAQSLGIVAPGSKDGEGGSQPGPSDREIEVAVADARCAQESGYDQARYDAQWDTQEAVVDQNRTELDRIRANVETRQADVMQIIAENAPAGR